MRAALRLQAAGGLAAPLCLCVLAVVAVCAPLIYIALLAVSVYSTPGLIRQLSIYTCAPAPPRERIDAAGARPAGTLVLQASDERYAPLLTRSRPVHMRWAARNNATLRAKVMRDGYANLVRIWTLANEVERGEYDWLLYVDADALIVDPTNVDIAAVMRTTRADGHAMAFCTAGRTPFELRLPPGTRVAPAARHDVNDGVFLADLRNPAIRQLACTWRRRAAWERWRATHPLSRWVAALRGQRGQKWISSQRLLQLTLADLSEHIEWAVYERDTCAINYPNGSLVRHATWARKEKDKVRYMRDAMRDAAAARAGGKTPLSARGRPRPPGATRGLRTSAGPPPWEAEARELIRDAG